MSNESIASVFRPVVMREKIGQNVNFRSTQQLGATIALGTGKNKQQAKLTIETYNHTEQVEVVNTYLHYRVEVNYKIHHVNKDKAIELLKENDLYTTKAAQLIDYIEKRHLDGVANTITDKNWSEV